MLSALAASKPGGRLLELGTGTGLGSAWMLQGMDERASLVSVDSDATCLEVAKRHLESDPRVRFVHQEAGEFLREAHQDRFDLVFCGRLARKVLGPRPSNPTDLAWRLLRD